MGMQEVLGRLKGVRGPNSRGGYMAKCPCHDDKTASLSIDLKTGSDGKERIFLFDHAGCATETILQALGLTMRDLIVNPDPPRSGAGNGARATVDKSRAARNRERAAESENQAARDGERTAEDGNRTADGERTTTVGGVTVHTVGEREGSGAGGRGAAGGAAGNGGGVGGNGGNAGAGNGSRNGGSTGGAGGAGGTEEEKKEERRIDWDHPDKVYSYTDENGTEVFQVVRYHYLDAEGKVIPKEKDFRQRMRPTEEQKRDGKTKISRDGWVHAVPAELRNRTLYRMPAVLQAIKEGRPVYVVEGEKDVETLERLGFTATCNPGGAGKWSDEYTRILAGGDLIILPDNDPRGKEGRYPGQDHALTVALRTQESAKRVRLVDMKEACPELPEKGDVSDMVKIMGDTEAMDALARQVNATRDFDPQAVPFWLTPAEQAVRLYAAIGSGYGAEGGCIVQRTGDSTKALTDFVVIPRMELTLDDGVRSTMSFVLDGWNSQGRKLKRVTISGGELDGMNWVTDAWGFDASLMPGTTTKNKVAWTIKKVGQMTAQRVTEYRHTGWRKIGGEWCYLYQGGAIGREGVRVNMGDSVLSKYRLDGGGTPAFREIGGADACRKSLSLVQVMKKSLGIALLGTMYLAPLREWMLQTDVSPAFALFLYGDTGTHKSTAAALALSHFGNFHSKSAPANFHDTGNQIREKAFLLKDMPILVDDFHPTTSQQEKRQMNATAQNLCRAFGDGADRGRLNADSTIRAARPPRSVAMITGEVLPSVGASGLARYFIVDVDKGDVPFTKEFTQLQEDARVGYLQKAMRGYIQWLIGQADKLPDTVHRFFIQQRDFIRDRSGGAHDRAPETVACILTGYGYMLKYFESVGVITKKEWGEMMLEAQRAMAEISEKQTRSMESEKPTQIFLTMLTELLRSHQAGVRDLTIPDEKDPIGTIKMIGYRDHEYYYLLPDVAQGMVSQLCRQQGEEFPVTLKALYKHLRTDGILPPITGSGDTYTRMKWIDGKSVRLLWIPAERIDGPRAGAQQTRMDVSSMAEADGEEIPEEWK